MTSMLSWLTKRVRGKLFPECENISPIKIYGSDCVATSGSQGNLFSWDDI